MTLADKIAAVAAAEADCERRREAIDAAHLQLASELRRVATPGRIVVSGLALGFATGLREPAAGPSLAGKVLGGPVFSMVAEAVLPGLVAGIMAKAGLQEADEEETQAEDDGDAGASDETDDGDEPGDGDDSGAADDADDARARQAR